MLDGVCLVWTAAIVSKGAYHLQSTYEHDGEDKSGSLDKKAAMCCANSRSWSWLILRGGGAFAGRSKVLWRGWCANGRRATVDQQQSELVWRRIEASVQNQTENSDRPSRFGQLVAAQLENRTERSQ